MSKQYGKTVELSYCSAWKTLAVKSQLISSHTEIMGAPCCEVKKKKNHFSFWVDARRNRGIFTWVPTKVVAIAILGLLSGCATQTTSKTLETAKVESYNTVYQGEKSTMIVGAFENRSDYANGIFSSTEDRLGTQAKTILKTHLQQTNRFRVMDRDSADKAALEAQYLGKKQQIQGARYAVVGAVTEFGRKEVGDKQLFGLLGAGKQQIAYAKVSLNLVDVLTSEIVYSSQGAGEYSLSEREVLGFGSNARYDSTLNGKVLNLAITEAVNVIVRDFDSGKLNMLQQ
jgi:curli biogenesis system outer membrane secretion channel CsgG